MSKTTIPGPVLYFSSCLYRSDLYEVEQIQKILEEHNLLSHPTIYGGEDYALLNYYAKEMGDKSLLKRVWFFSQKPMPRKLLVELKLWAKGIECETAVDGRRTLNFDPGYISLDQVLLSTGKAYSHRVYLDRGVYGELTYQAQNATFCPLPWTYPDYLRAEVIEVFEFQRQYLKNALKA